MYCFAKDQLGPYLEIETPLYCPHATGAPKILGRNSQSKLKEILPNDFDPLPGAQPRKANAEQKPVRFRD